MFSLFEDKCDDFMTPYITYVFVQVCMTCIRCKSCGVTPGKTWDLTWNHEQDLCPDCTSLHKKGKTSES